MNEKAQKRLKAFVMWRIKRNTWNCFNYVFTGGTSVWDEVAKEFGGTSLEARNLMSAQILQEEERLRKEMIDAEKRYLEAGKE